MAEKLGQQLGSRSWWITSPALAAISARRWAKADPDGYTLLLGYDGTLVINPNVYAKVPFDPVKDFTPIGKIGDAVLMIAANPKLGIKNVADLQHYAKTVAGGMSYGSAGNGSTTHLAGEMFHQRTGIPMTRRCRTRVAARPCWMWSGATCP